MGWLLLILLAAFVFAALWWVLRRNDAGVMPVAIVLLLGIAGYAVQGHPGAGGAPAPTPPSSTRSEGAVAADVLTATKGVTDAAQVLTLADSYLQKGDNRMAAELLDKAVKMEPGNPDLWVALGNALVLHADGMVTPAANHAFERALVIMPDHPGPPFFRGLAMAQAGQYDQAAATWRELLARSPKDAPWRADLEQRLAGIEAILGESAPNSSVAPPQN